MMRRLMLTLAALLALGLPAAASEEDLARAVEEIRQGRAAEAAAIYRALADAGDGAGQFNLGLLYLTGRGLPQNHAEALYWAWRARLSGVAEAPALIARMADLTTPDLRKSLAERLFADLQPRIDRGEGRAMLERAGVSLEVLPEPDLAGALVWQSLAAALEVPGADAARDATGRRMEAKDRLAAEAQAVEVLKDLCTKGLKDRPICAVAF